MFDKIIVFCHKRGGAGAQFAAPKSWRGTIYQARFAGARFAGDQFAAKNRSGPNLPRTWWSRRRRMMMIMGCCNVAMMIMGCCNSNPSTSSTVAEMTNWARHPFPFSSFPDPTPTHHFFASNTRLNLTQTTHQRESCLQGVWNFWGEPPIKPKLVTFCF